MIQPANISVLWGSRRDSKYEDLLGNFFRLFGNILKQDVSLQGLPAVVILMQVFGFIITTIFSGILVAQLLIKVHFFHVYDQSRLLFTTCSLTFIIDGNFGQVVNSCQ